MLNRLFLILALSIFTDGTFASYKDICASLDCRKKNASHSTIKSKESNILILGSIIKKNEISEKYCSTGNDEDEICYMTQRKAKEYCEAQKSQLPSAREMAQLTAMFGGTKGVVDTCGDDSECYSIKAKNHDGTIDEFNYSPSGYVRPEGDLGNNWYWLSSVDPDDTGYAFFLNGKYGGIGLGESLDNRLSINKAVICVTSGH